MAEYLTKIDVYFHTKYSWLMSIGIWMTQTLKKKVKNKQIWIRIILDFWDVWNLKTCHSQSRPNFYFNDHYKVLFSRSCGFECSRSTFFIRFISCWLWTIYCASAVSKFVIFHSGLFSIFSAVSEFRFLNFRPIFFL